MAIHRIIPKNKSDEQRTTKGVVSDEPLTSVGSEIQMPQALIRTTEDKKSGTHRAVLKRTTSDRFTPR
jgi:hypothetical protein